MFDSCKKLTTLDVSSFDTSNVTNMYVMFGGCNSLTKISFGSGITNIGGYSLCYCENLQEIVVNDIDKFYDYDQNFFIDNDPSLPF